MVKSQANLAAQVRTLFGVGAVGALTDRQVLEQFSKGHRETAEAAFATLVERHGPMVLRVCRGVLGDSHDVHDAFQATFLVLVRRADSLWVRDSLGPWLYSVAFRVAMKAQVARLRRSVHEQRGAALGEARQNDEHDDEVTATLHEELDRLPQKYRAPIVLCYLEGLTHEGAATTLGWPVGTVRGRLARARDLLRSRLIRRGLAPAAAATAASFAADEALAAPIPDSIIQAALSLVSERAGGVAPTAVVALADRQLRLMAFAKLKIAAGVCLTMLVVLGLFQATRSARTQNELGGDPPSPAAPGALAQQKAEPKVWPAGVEVRGRVVDHRGAPVTDADVLLLGAEQLIVHASPGPEEGHVRRNLSILPSDGDGVVRRSSSQPAGDAATAKTDARGEFSVKRAGSPADRIAVVSDRLLLWEVTRKELPKETNFTITLPEPCSLTLHAEIPDKPAKQEFWVVARPGERTDWQSDCLYYRELQVPNPGNRIVNQLPPAQYAVERINYTPQGPGASLMSPSERRLLGVGPGRSATLTYDRKDGRAVTGRVKGIENVDLRFALVTINIWGPEEQFTPEGKKSRILTAFDVVPVAADGSFSTPPLPANEYQFWLSAMRASTPRLDNQTYDFDGSTTAVVPATGPAPTVEIIAKEHRSRRPDVGKARDPKEPRLEVRARDEAGQPITDFVVQLYDPVRSAPTAIGSDGLAVLFREELKDWNFGDLIVSARGFASKILEQGPIDSLRNVDVTLARGTKVRMKVLNAAGEPIPSAIMPLPQVYLPRHHYDGWFALALGDPDARAQTVERLNFLNVLRDVGGEFTFHVRTDKADPLYFGFSHPDVLRYYELGPIPASDLASGEWTIVLPRPATLEVKLKPILSADGQALIARGHYSLLPVITGNRGAVPGLEFGEMKGPEWQHQLARLAPGSYNLQVVTEPHNAAAPMPNPDALPGRYFDTQKISLKAGETTSAMFEPTPFRADAWRGTRSAVITLKAPGDRSPKGERYSVAYMLPHYGRLQVAEGQLGSDGRIALERIAASGINPAGGYYMVEVDGEYVGQFRVEEQTARQEFTFSMPAHAGDVAPDGSGIDLATAKPKRISDYRGRVVFLEFWASWCGPCREPMERLAALAKRRSAAWRNDVSLVAIGIDNERDQLWKHIQQRGLATFQHLWSPDDHSEPSATAHASYGIRSVPAAFLIDRDGRILWRGHPASIDVESRIEQLLQRK
jgi:RNA polymerase sigma factor (sigma-70 family)